MRLQYSHHPPVHDIMVNSIFRLNLFFKFSINALTSVNCDSPHTKVVLPTHTRPSSPTARPGKHSHLKEPSVFTQRPFMHMPTVSHSSMSVGEENEKKLNYIVFNACPKLAFMQLIFNGSCRKT